MPRSCGRLTVAPLLALRLGQQVATLAQRFYAWCCEASPKAGATRQAREGTTGFVPLLHWRVLRWTGTPLALARDAPAWGTRFVVLAVCVV
jgi:membrane protein required for beta-lactamase induction